MMQEVVAQRDGYIEELEEQLREVRAQLLEVKLACTDKEDAVHAMQAQLAT